LRGRPSLLNLKGGGVVDLAVGFATGKDVAIGTDEKKVANADEGEGKAEWVDLRGERGESAREPSGAAAAKAKGK